MAETIKILSVDDSSLTRTRFVANPLREAGYEVVEATNGAEGLKALAEHNPACIISDLLMPVMDGFEFIKQARGQGFTGPIVVVSADIQQSSRARVEELGIDRFLNKPFEKDELLAAVGESLAARYGQECAPCS